MKISAAIEQARKAQNPEWSFAQIAALTGVSETTARRWESGSFVPRGDQLMSLRRELPGFAELLDSNDVSVA